MRQAEASGFESYGPSSGIIAVSEIATSIRSDETAYLVDRVDLRELGVGDELLLCGQKLVQYFEVKGISDAGNPRIKQVPVMSRQTLDSVRAVIKKDNYALLGSCSGVNSDWGAAIAPRRDVIEVGRRAWMLDLKGALVKEIATDYDIVKIARICPY